MDSWRIFADEMTYDRKADRFIAKGGVRIQKPGRELTADHVSYDRLTRRAQAEGHVALKAGEDTLMGDRAELDLESGTGTIYQGSAFTQFNHFYIKADVIQKTGPLTYVAQDASITTCDGESPDWKLTCQELEVTVEGYGVAQHAALWGKSLPLLYSPLLVFPAKTKRQSGLLVPEISFSDRKGFDWNQPLFLALKENMDVTFYSRYMSARGAKLGAEFRYIAAAETQHGSMFDFLNDSRRDDGTGRTSKLWGYENDGYLRSNSDRYWLRMKHDQAMGYGVAAKLDLDVVSDQDYLLEFEDGYNGFRSTQDYFLGAYGRGLDDYNQTIRKNQLNLNKIWVQYALNGDLLWYDDVLKRRWEKTDNTLQKLPHIQFHGLKQRVGPAPFYWDLVSEYAYLFRKDGNRGQRGELHPRIYAPISYQHYFTFEPSAGVRETLWYVNRHDDGSEADQAGFNRQIPDVRLDLSTEVQRIFSVRSLGIDALKHAVRPQLVYDFIPEQAQTRYPLFDAFDRIQKQNRLTYSIANTLIARRPLADQGNEIKLPDAYKASQHVYSEFCYFHLSQSYDINAARESSDPKPFSAVTGLLELNPSSQISLRVDWGWDPYTKRFVSHSEALRWADERGDSLLFEFRRAAEISETVCSLGNILFSERWSAYGKYERNLKDGKNVETGLGLRYTSQCWALDIAGMQREKDSIYRFMIHLYGLGQTGTSIAAPH